eukprot:jgi/Tetstr1/421269/TSEL_001142.t1
MPLPPRMLATRATVSSLLLLVAGIHASAEYEYAVSQNLGCKDPTLGDKIENIDLETCQSLCTATDDCNFITFNTSRRNCFLKATCRDAQPNDDDVIGRKVAGGSPPSEDPPVGGMGSGDKVSYAITHNLGCKDPTLGDKIENVDLETCQSLCTARDGCNFITLNTRKRNCFLKATCDNAQRHDDDLVGRRVVDGSPPSEDQPIGGMGSSDKVSYAITQNLGCKDPTLGDKIENVDLETCQSLCTATGDCNFITFNTRRRNCFMKATCDNAQPNNDDVIGRKVAGGVPPDSEASARCSVRDEAWRAHTIDNRWKGADGARTADINGDGRPDIVVG